MAFATGAAWLLGAWLIGLAGRRYRFGFWGYFFASILLTPIIGLLLLIAAKPTRQTKRWIKMAQKHEAHVRQR